MPRNRKMARSKPKSRKKKRGSNVRSTTVKRNPFKSLTVTGIRAIIAALPGATFISPLVDMFLTSIGLSKQTFQEQSAKFKIDGTSIIGLSGMVMLGYKNIMARTPQAALNITKDAKGWVDTPFNEARLITLKITALPDNKISERSGRWGMMFIPFHTVNDFGDIQKEWKPLSLRNMQGLPGCVISSADRPLTLSFTPKAADGYIYHYNSMNDAFGVIVLSYSEEMRVTYHDFSANDYSPNITCTGTIELRQPYFGGGAVGFEDSMWSAGIPSMIYSDKDKKFVSFAEKDFSCAKSNNYQGQCIVQGTAYVPKTYRTFKEASEGKSDLSLEDMTLE